jgi:hypothetical protein
MSVSLHSSGSQRDASEPDVDPWFDQTDHPLDATHAPRPDAGEHPRLEARRATASWWRSTAPTRETHPYLMMRLEGALGNSRELFGDSR